MMIFPCLVVQCLLGLIMFGGEFLISFVPEAGVQARMKEHVMGKIHYGKSCMNNILFKNLLNYESK